jgi:hypothetical protein
VNAVSEHRPQVLKLDVHVAPGRILLVLIRVGLPQRPSVALAVEDPKKGAEPEDHPPEQEEELCVDRPAPAARDTVAQSRAAWLPACGMWDVACGMWDVGCEICQFGSHAYVR